MRGGSHGCRGNEREVSRRPQSTNVQLQKTDCQLTTNEVGGEMDHKYITRPSEGSVKKKKQIGRALV